MPVGIVLDGSTWFVRLIGFGEHTAEGVFSTSTGATHWADKLFDRDTTKVNAKRLRKGLLKPTKVKFLIMVRLGLQKIETVNGNISKGASIESYMSFYDSIKAI